ncbi:MAG: DUF2509 family protein [Sodalis sp. (in: enterobacteria)]|uniref:DUF2509 family protein n=1 Tax=Sodalis sp. (in: enterobacteria) TaxID=1898979 RepID=UPI003F3240D8
MRRERGSSSVLALLLLSAFCLLAMLSWQRLLQESLALARAQRHYLQTFHQAVASRAWGLSQRWPARHGECRQHPAEPLRICLQASKRGYGWLLCGEGGGTLMAPPLRHYQRVTLYRAEARPVTGEQTASGNTTAAGPDAQGPAPGGSAAVNPLSAPGDAPAEAAFPGTGPAYFLRARRGSWLDFDPG